MLASLDCYVLSGTFAMSPSGLYRMERTMNSKLAGIASMIAILGLSGCATMNANECAMSDWRTIGFEDGAQGFTAERLGRHRKACAKHGVAPDLTAYQGGREEGLRQYCQPSRGFDLGTGGGQYNGVCPGDLEPDFVDAFNTGQQLYTLRAGVNNANNQINVKRAQLENTNHRVTAAEAELIHGDTTTEDRILLLSELKELSERTGLLEAEILSLVEERVLYQHELSSFEAMLADTSY